MIDTPITKNSIKIRIISRVKRQDKRSKKSDRGEKIWELEKVFIVGCSRSLAYGNST